MSRVSRPGARIRAGVIAGAVLGVLAASPRLTHAQGANLALGMSVTRSSDCSTSAVDGNVDTYWQPLSADRTEDLNVWLRVDLGAPASIDRAVLNFHAGTTDILQFRIRTSTDEVSAPAAVQPRRWMAIRPPTGSRSAPTARTTGTCGCAWISPRRLTSNTRCSSSARAPPADRVFADDLRLRRRAHPPRHGRA